MSELGIMNRGLILASACPQTICWRNLTGFAWAGDKLPVGMGQRVNIGPGMVVLRNAHPVRYGKEGSPDVLGVTAGRAWGQEYKTPIGRQQKEQVLFQRAYEAAGGVYELPRTVEAGAALPYRILSEAGLWTGGTPNGQ